MNETVIERHHGDQTVAHDKASEQKIVVTGQQCWMLLSNQARAGAWQRP